MTDQKPKRKTTTSTEVKQRWEASNYRKIMIRLRFDQDKALLAYLDAHKDIGTTELFRKALKYYAEKHPY